MGMKLIDETGNKYGTLTVISLTKDKNNRTAWLCECDCGNKKIVRGSDLRKGKITTCGYNCPCKEYYHKDLTGQRFGRLVAIEPTKDRKQGKIVWRCQCDCGADTYVSSLHLQQKRVQSCGCLFIDSRTGPKKDLTGQSFGFLTVIENTNKQDKYSNFIWLCQCSCGNTIEINTPQLTQEKTISCGCKSKSHGEAIIEEILNRNNILFTPQKSFSDLVSDKNHKLRFDFEITYNGQKGYIEFNGKQHYEPVEHFGGEEALIRTQQHELQKINWCKQNNVPILIIKYDNKNIEQTILDFLKTF